MPPEKETEGRRGPVMDASLWVDAHGDRLYRFALMRVRDASVAEELVQETFLAALNAMQGFEGHSSERTWLTGILKHKILDHFRRAARELPTEEIEAEADAWFNKRGHWSVAPSRLGNPVSDIEREELRGQLAGCIQELSERLARAFVLTQIDGLATAEACKLLGISATNLWVILHRARLRLRQCLENEGLGREKR